MADNNKAVGPLATAKLVALIKAVTAKKYDKTGGKIDGNAEITGGLKVGMSSEFSSSIKAGSEISSDMLLMAPIVELRDPAKEESISFGVSGENAAKVTSPVPGGGTQYARLAVGTPTGDNDATPKTYVDGRTHDYYDVTVISAADAAQTIDGGIISVRGSADKTVAEIAAAYAAGAIVRCIYGGNIMPLVRAEDGSYSFAGTGANYGVARGGNITVTIMSTTSNGDTTLITSAAGELPIPDSDVSQNGCALVVRDGQWMYSEDKLIPATPTSNGLMSAADKAKLDSMDSVCYDIYAKIGTADTHDSVYKYGCMVSHTFAEINAAVHAGKTPRVLLVDNIDNPSDTRVICPLSEYDTSRSEGGYYFDAPGLVGVSGSGRIYIDENGAMYTCSAGELPAVDANQDGKYLTIDGGRWTYRRPDTATATTPGFMSAVDKAKLDGIEKDANKTVVDAALDAGSANPVQNKAVKAALDKKADKTALDTKADTTVATASANGLMSAADKEKLDSMYDIVATSTDGETFDITPAQLHEKLKGVPTTCAIKVVDTIIPLYRVQLQSGGDTRYIFQITKDNGFWEPNTRLAYTASAGGTYAGTTWVKSEYDLLASTPGILKFTGAAKAQFSGSKDVTIDIPTGEGTVRYDETQKLTSDQKFRASQNIGAVSQKHAFIDGVVMLQAIGHDDGASVVNITPSEKSNDYTLTLDGGPENVPVYVAGLETPTDAQTDYAANVAFVKAKIAEAAASGGVDVDNALSATSTNPVQNKVVKAALDKKAGTAVASTSANGLMSKADKTKLDDIERGANKTTIDSAMSGSSVNPVQNKVIKQYIDDKVAAGSNITVDATLSSTSANPVQNKAVKAAIDAKADKTALDAKADKTALDAKMGKSGGTFTGNVYGKYFCGTWLQSTAASDLGRTPGKIAVLDDSGWVYYRTPAELVGDLGIANAIKSYVDTAIVAAINSSY